MRADDRALVDAAASVADGAPVDWASAESRTDAENRRLVRHLRLVESIASLHRSIPDYEPALAHRRRPVEHPQPGAAGRIGAGCRCSIASAQGTSCEVFRAWDTALHREVALKLLHDEGDHADAHDRLLEEARRLARVRHAHVVQVYGAEQHDNRVGLWMELVRGESLEQIVQARGPFGAREAALIGLDLCAALAAVHGAGLLHRDIKAQNVMRESGGRLVLMDFGTGEELSGTNRLVGTPLYLAPEIFRGQRASVQSDLYSLGVLLFYLVTGKFPVVGRIDGAAGAGARAPRAPAAARSAAGPAGGVRRDRRARARQRSERAVIRASANSSPRCASRSTRRQQGSRRRPAGAVGVGSALAFVSAVAALALAVVALIVWTRATESNRGTVLSSIRSIAVLTMSEDPGSGLPTHFASGLTDELISTLGQVHALSVKSALSVKALKDLPPKEIADKLGVDAWLETTVSAGSPSRGGGDGVRVRANLIAAGTQTVVWTRLFERPRGETSALQADIAEAMVHAVGLTATPTESERFKSVRGKRPGRRRSVSPGPLPSRPVRCRKRRTGAEGFRARDHSRSAPRGRLRWRRTSERQPRVERDHLERAGARARRWRAHSALEFDQDLAEAHATLGYIHFIYDWDWAGAEREFRRSLDLNPNSPYARTFYAEFLAALGRFDEALVQTETGEATRSRVGRGSPQACPGPVLQA